MINHPLLQQTVGKIGDRLVTTVTHCGCQTKYLYNLLRHLLRYVCKRGLDLNNYKQIMILSGRSDDYYFALLCFSPGTKIMINHLIVF